jgi:hypothetical protein
LLQKPVFNLRIDLVKPLLCSLGSVAVRLDLGLQLINTILRRPKLM